jgi:cytochrome c peroxidase
MLRTTRRIGLAAALLALTAACQDVPTRVVLEPAPPGVGPAFDAAPLASGDIVALGQRIYEDADLSVGRNQSCQTCHEPSEGFAAALPGTVTRGSVVQGSVTGRFGDRKPPTAAYATLTPIFSGGNNPSGGVFWDGRGTGMLLGNPAADQALGPFVNPMEQALPDTACVVYRVKSYGAMYTGVWGNAIGAIAFPPDTETICTNAALSLGNHIPGLDRAAVRREYHNVARSIQAFEATFNRFSSRFDRGEMTPQEQQGQKLFSSKAKCQQCHSNKGSQPLFTDFAFHNLGVPKNPDNPVYHYGTAAFDPGLGGFTGRAAHVGKFRTPTTRNVAQGQNRTYMHNGALVSLRQVVDFYNTRDVLRRCTGAELNDPSRWGSTALGGIGCWPPPEHGANLDTKNMGKLGLTVQEVDAIVAYMEAMTDLDR